MTAVAIIIFLFLSPHLTSSFVKIICQIGVFVFILNVFRAVRCENNFYVCFLRLQENLHLVIARNHPEPEDLQKNAFLQLPQQKQLGEYPTVPCVVKALYPKPAAVGPATGGRAAVQVNNENTK